MLCCSVTLLPRPSGRAPDQMREIVLEPGFAKYAEGSCLARFGDHLLQFSERQFAQIGYPGAQLRHALELSGFCHSG